MNQRVKVSFPLSQEQGGSAERMYAQSIGDSGFILDNPPFYFFGISYCDEFFAHDVGGELVFAQIASRGGHQLIELKSRRAKTMHIF